ncbi:MAG: hypothetical protein ACD_39C01421G0002, partial [uncultured bacterium]
PFRLIRVKDLALEISEQRTGQTIFLQVPSVSIANTAIAGEMLVDLKSSIALADQGKSGKGPAVSIAAKFLAQKISPLIASGSVTIGPAPAEALLSMVKAAFPGRISGAGVKGGKAEAVIDFSIAAEAETSFSCMAQFQQIESIMLPTTQDSRQIGAIAVGGDLTFTGTIKNIAEPSLDLSGDLQDADSGAIFAVLSRLFPAIPGDLKFSGKCDTRFRLLGNALQPQLQGTLVLKDIEVSAPIMMRPFQNVRGSIKFDTSSLTTDDLAGKWGTSAVKVTGQVSDLPAFKMSLKYVVNPLDLTDAGKFFLPPNGYTLNGSGQADGNITGVPANAVIEGTVKSPSCQLVAPISANNKSAFAFPFQNLVAAFRYSGETLSIENAHAGLFEGTISGTGTVHPRKTPISFKINAKGQGIKSEAFLAQNTSQKQVVSGPVNATFQADGNTTGLASWNGKGSLMMQNGRYQAPPVITPVLALVNLKEFSSGDVREASGTFALHDGIMTTNDLFCLSTAGKAFYRGDVGLDTTLKGQLNLTFFQEAVEKSQALQQISLDGKSANIPTRVEGTLLAPSFPGFSSGKLLELGLKRTGQKMLQDIIQGGKTPSKTEPASTGQKESGKQLIEGLQNIFRKKKKPAANPVTAPESSKTPAPAPKQEDLLKNELKKLFKF